MFLNGLDLTPNFFTTLTGKYSILKMKCFPGLTLTYHKSYKPSSVQKNKCGPRIFYSFTSSIFEIKKFNKRHIFKIEVDNVIQCRTNCHSVGRNECPGLVLSEKGNVRG